MTARWYDPASGAFSSRDSAALPANPSSIGHRYNYGAGAPTNYTRPRAAIIRRETGATGTRSTAGATHGPRLHLRRGKARQAVPVATFRPKRSQGGDDCTAHQGVRWQRPSGTPCPGGRRGPAPGVVQPRLSVNGSGDGDTEPGGRNPNKPQGYNYQPPPPPDPAIAARAENRRAAMNNPMPIPAALDQPLYGDSYDAPVSSSPTTPSQQFADQVDPSDGVTLSYQEIERSITQGRHPADEGRHLGQQVAVRAGRAEAARRQSLRGRT